MAAQTNQETTGLWLYHMRRGEFEAAWEHGDAVVKSRAGIPCWHLPRHYQYIWDGSSPDGKRVLVRCYHGLGDTIQFIRYMPLLKAVASEVIVWVQPGLIELLKSAEGIDQLLPLHDGSPEVEYDLDLEIMELPHIFRTTVRTIPNKIPYLSAEPMPLPRKQKKLAVGLVWRAGDWDEGRSIAFSFYTLLAGLNRIQFYIVQPGAIEAGWQGAFGTYPGEFGLFDYAKCLKSLDLLITIDSMPAHLAGALGMPVWTLLQAEADWRWMDTRLDSPWYPTMRLFRQERPGEWEPVLMKVRAELELFSRNQDVDGN